jgi:hypothetical protein
MVRRLVDDDARHMELSIPNNLPESFVEAAVQIGIAEAGENAATFNNVLPVQARNWIVRVPAENFSLQKAESPSEAPVGKIDVKPDSQQGQVSMVVVVRELERVIARLVDVEAVTALFLRHACKALLLGQVAAKRITGRGARSRHDSLRGTGSFDRSEIH